MGEWISDANSRMLISFARMNILFRHQGGAFPWITVEKYWPTCFFSGQPLNAVWAENVGRRIYSLEKTCHRAAGTQFVWVGNVGPVPVKAYTGCSFQSLNKTDL